MLPEPGTANLIVLASGEAFVIEPASRRCVRRFGGQICDVFWPRPDLLVFSNGLWMEAIGPSELKWKSRRISWDGLRSVQVQPDTITGESWTPLRDAWVGFSLDVASGAVSGGAYPEDMGRNPSLKD